ncbi:MAG: N-acetylmuramoyl-L-alanine amidase [Verrucomicrobiota bacterium]
MRRVLGWATGLWLGGCGLVVAEDGEAEPPEEAWPDLSGIHVAFDVGHSLSKMGARSARGRSEFLFNQDTARTVAQALIGAGAKVTIINEDGTITGLSVRPQTAVKKKADVFISLHHDSVNEKYIQTWTFEGTELPYSDDFRGYSVFCSEKNFLAEKSRKVALEVGKQMKAAGFPTALHHNEPIPGENRKFWDEETAVYEFTDLIVAKAGRIPSILLECGVIIHREEELEVQKEAYQLRIAHALAKALSALREDKVIGKRKLFGLGLR